MQFFSKLPCIKTCMSKLTFDQEPNQKQISFENMEDDFIGQSNNQLSSSDCKYTCDAQNTICPEILPTNCDDYFEKKCNCTVYCKKTLKFLQQFVKDEVQIAEIEDLCQSKD